jgi:glycosyltransferase involved in cell wall biosynthesis
MRRLLLSSGHKLLNIRPFSASIEAAVKPFGNFTWRLDSVSSATANYLQPALLYDRNRVRRLSCRRGDTLILVSEVMATEVNIESYFAVVEELLRHVCDPAYRPCTYHIGRFMFETDRIHPRCVGFINKFDEIWVPSHCVQHAYEASGVTKPILVVPEAVDPNDYRVDIEPLTIPGARRFNFLAILNTVSKSTFNGQRKAWDILLRSFLEEFEQEEDVGIILKTLPDRGTISSIRSEIRHILGERASGGAIPPNVVIYDRALAPEDMPRLYKAAQAYVLPTRGEGWGRPFMEALTMNLPTIATGWGGHVDFMNTRNSYLIDHEMVECPSHFEGLRIPLAPGHRWAEPSRTHLQRLMREVFVKFSESEPPDSRQEIIARYSPDAVARPVAQRLTTIQRNHRAPAAVDAESSRSSRSEY